MASEPGDPLSLPPWFWVTDMGLLFVCLDLGGTEQFLLYFLHLGVLTAHHLCLYTSFILCLIPKARDGIRSPGTKFVCFVCLRQVSLGSPGYPGTHYVDQACLKLLY